MRQFRPLAFVLLVVFAFGAVVAASASARKATPEVTPVAGFTDKSGASNFAGAGVFGTNTVACASSTSIGTYQTTHLGTFKVLFEKCLLNKLGLFLCTGLNTGEATSSIVTTGTFHLRYREEGNGTKSVIAFLIKVVHFTCVKEATKILVEVRGCAAGEITPVNTEVKVGEHYTMDMKKSATATRNEITRIENEAGTGLETCQLETHEEGGAAGFQQSAEETKDEIFPLVVPTTIVA